ncbi:hypothetical protein KXW58_003033 [Aspergillus fumigatus]|nr:hypothetical protein KXW58_003033 [Aspergillus fumigatus]
MSQHPPASAIGGPPRTQQWPRSHIFPSTSMPSSLATHLPFSQDISSAHQPQDNGNQPYNYNDLTNINMTSSLPGLGGPVAGFPLPPPPFPFMGQFTPSQFNTPSFPPIQMPPLRYPPLSIPAANIQAPSRPSSGDLRSQANSVSINDADSRAARTPITRKDYDREEGELTDMEMTMPTSSENAGLAETRDDAIPSTLTQQNGYTTGTCNTTTLARDKESRRSPAAKSCDPSTLDLEEGEASSTGSHISARKSESPYDPPGSGNPDPFMSNGASGASSHEDTSFSTTKDVSGPHGSGKLVAQLRIQAQGALLRLAPHNIRYSELVREGINPAVLRQLYEEVGIRVPTPQLEGVSPAINPPTKPVDVPGKPAGAGLDSASSSSVDNGPAPVALDRSKGETETPVAAAAANAPAPAPTSTIQHSTTAKPLERKEVIARMLAAKAAKTSGMPSTPQTDSAKEALSSESSVSALVGKDTPASSGRETPPKEKDIRTREKNKAKTELARQRIEQLKKQGLVRSQQKAQIDPMRRDEIPQSNGNSPAPVSQVSNTPMIQHPLPDRPPDPESTVPSRIPGLFMTELSEPSGTRVRSLVIDSTPQPHVNQRKRPRASDFDEPSLTLKGSHNGVNHSATEDRLIIEVSDDEFYGDDENEKMEIDPAGKTTLEGGSIGPEGLSGTVPSSADFLPQRPVASSQGISASATPQSHKNLDQEDLRKKDLEIQAMRRRIAELEQRKKAKLAASRTQSPRPSEVAVSSSAISPTSVDQERPTSNVISEPVDHKLPPQLALLKADTEAIPSVPVNNPVNSEKLSSESIARISALKDIDHLNEMRSKLLRKKEIESGVPALEVEIQKSEARLAEVKLEEQNLLHDIAKGKEGRQQLLDELHSLDLELKGLTLEELEIAQRALDAKEQVQASDKGSTHLQSCEARYGSSLPDIPATESRSQGAACPVEGSPGSRLASGAEPSATSDLSLDAERSDHAVDPANDAASSSPSESLGSAMDESADSSEDSVPAGHEEPMECETPTPEPSLHAALSGIPATDRKPVEDEMTPDHALSEQQRTLHAPDAGDAGDVFNPNADEVQKLEKQSSRESSISDAYEPPEPEAESSPSDSVYTPPFSPVSLASVKSAEVSRVERADMPLMGKVQEVEVQPGTSSPHGLSNDETQEEKTPRYTPYVSPLRWFKAYRYHPRFTENVSGGFRSLTYSHNIDSEKYLCPYEATGGVCNDRSCDLQHFRDITLSDDKILVQMGSLREGKTPEEKDQYIAGLKQIINDMRRDKVKDFNTVATEIAAYRRRFLQDPSRVLPL